MRRLLPAAALLLVLGPCAAPAQAVPGRPGREISLPPAEVKDTFFAYVLGIIRSGIEVDIDNDGMRAILTEFKTALNLPFDLVSGVTQHTDASGRMIGIHFSRDVTIPIPFSILFYHPGSIVSTPLVTFDVQTAPGPAFVLGLTSGSIVVDIDDWLEVLLRAYIEDTVIQHLVFFTWHGDWMGLLQGKGRRTGRDIRAFFNFTRNTIIFPTPAALDAAARTLLP